MSELSQRDLSDEDSAANRLVTIAFLQRMMPHWFMRPFLPSAGGAVEQGVQNKNRVICVLRKRHKDLSDGDYTIHGKIRDFGLVEKKGHPYCTISPVGVLALMRRNSQGKYYFLSLCVLEMKTRSIDNTIDALIESVLQG